MNNAKNSTLNAGKMKEKKCLHTAVWNANWSSHIVKVTISAMTQHDQKQVIEERHFLAFTSTP